jgi:hypothetical protein
LPESVDGQALAVAFDRAIAAWSVTRCSGPVAYLSWNAADGHAAADGINTIAFVEADELPGGLPSDTPAVTELQYERDRDGAWTIVEADIYLNADRDWSPLADQPVDLASVLTHELGHVFGLLHPCEPEGAQGAPECTPAHHESLMFPLYYDTASGIGADDQEGYCYLYPEPLCDPAERGCPQPVESCPLGRCSDDFDVDAGAEPGEEVDEPSSCDAETDAGSCELSEFASPCDTGAECTSGLCVGEDPESATCTRSCDTESDPCPSGFECRSVGGMNVCLSGRDQGCSATRVGASKLPGALGLCCAAIMLFAHRRRNRRRESRRIEDNTRC